MLLVGVSAWADTITGRVIVVTDRGTIRVLDAHRLSAGFPSPAVDYAEYGLDLNDYLVRRKSATYVFTGKGDSMIGASCKLVPVPASTSRRSSPSPRCPSGGNPNLLSYAPLR